MRVIIIIIILPMQSIQNQAAKLVLLKRKYDSAKNCLKALHWLPIVQRIEFKVLCLVFKCIHNEAPDYLRSLIIQHNTAFNTRSKSQLTLLVPRNSSSFGSRAFSVAGPKLWNKLPAPLRSEETFSLFKKKLKTHLFKLAFN